MNGTVFVRRYRRDDRAAVFDLLRVAYSTDDSERLVRQWDWKYDANPFNREADPYVLLLQDGDELIGMLGGLPLRVVVGGREHWLSHSCDWVLHPRHRDRGVARRLPLQHRADLQLHFSWTNELSYRRSRAFSNTRFERLTPLVKPLDAGYALQQVSRLGVVHYVAALLARGGRTLLRHRQAATATPGVTVGEIDSFDQRFDALWQRVRGDHLVAIVRDQRYLTWRFVRRPDARYTILAATRAGEVSGYLVLRLTDRGGVQRGYLVDFLVEGRSLPTFSLLVEHAVERLRGEGAKAVSCRVISAPYRRRLYRHGFWPMPWGPRGYMRVDCLLPDPDVQDFRHPKRWFATMGDGDLEMAF
jgi:Acetyltransferase (GNAT) domain